MIAALPRLLIVRLLAALLLTAAGLQAAAPIGDPITQTHGSAFSATTFESALAPRQRGSVAVVAPQPTPALPALPVIVAAALMVLPVQRVAPRPASTAPPPATPRDRRPDPRAPPRS